MNRIAKIGILVGTIGVIGTISYLVYNRIKKSNTLSKKTETDSENELLSESKTKNSKSKLVLGIYKSTPFKNETQGNLFREWVNDNYPKYAKEIDLDRKGAYNNDYIRTAYAKYGDEFMKKSLYGNKTYI